MSGDVVNRGGGIVTPPAVGVDPATPPAIPMAQIPLAEWEGLKAKLDVFEKIGIGNRLGNQVPAAPTAPIDTLDQQLAVYDNQIAAIDVEIDKLIEKGEPISKLNRQRDKLIQAQTRLEIKHRDLDPAFNQGITAIDALSSEISRGKMKYYEIVKPDMDQILAGIPADQRMSPTVRESAYQLAVGKNMVKIMDAQREEILRSSVPDPNLIPGNKNSRNGANAGSTVPSPRDVLGKEGMAALNQKGITVEQYYKNLGYAGWEDFWNKRGKDYFGEEGDE